MFDRAFAPLLPPLFAIALAGPAFGQCETAELTPPGAAAGDWFGRSLAADGEWVAVGAGDVVGPGRVWLLRRDGGGGFAFAQELAEPAGGDHFGYALALDGGTLAVGAPADGPSTPGLGAVHVYELAGERWEHVERLQPATDPPHSAFGKVLALDGDVLAIGAWNENVDIGAPGPPYAASAGAVHVYRRAPAGWELDVRLVAPDPQNLDWFGYAVAVEGDVLAVGYPKDDDAGSDFGSVRIHRRTGPGTWVAGEVLLSAAGSLAAEFGSGLALDGGRLVVAEPFGAADGSLALFDSAGGAFAPVATLALGTAATFGSYHEALALDGDRLVAGARTFVVAEPSDGAVYVVDGFASGAPSVTVLAQELGGQGHWFGMAVALDGDELLVTAPGDESFGDLSGALAVISIAEKGCQTLFADVGTASIGTGAPQALALHGPAEHAGLPYLVLGSATGTAPGIAVDGLVLPLALDAYTLHTLSQPNQPPLAGGFGVLWGFGPSTAWFAVPPGLDPGLAGLTVHHAYAVLDPAAGQVVHTSNAVATLLVP